MKQKLAKDLVQGDSVLVDTETKQFEKLTKVVRQNDHNGPYIQIETENASVDLNSNDWVTVAD